MQCCLPEGNIFLNSKKDLTQPNLVNCSDHGQKNHCYGKVCSSKYGNISSDVKVALWRFQLSVVLHLNVCRFN